ncbi:hypothetical protein J2W96_005846 [Variovorax guangxiensis]|nr:hypothetical protein [Variovorax guangxiensis]
MVTGTATGRFALAQQRARGVFGGLRQARRIQRQAAFGQVGQRVHCGCFHGKYLT